jgi:hypothetical protein
VQAKEEWLQGRLVQASASLDSAAAELGPLRLAPPGLCDDLRIAGAAIRALHPALATQAAGLLERSGAKPCPAS